MAKYRRFKYPWLGEYDKFEYHTPGRERYDSIIEWVYDHLPFGKYPLPVFSPVYERSDRSIKYKSSRTPIQRLADEAEERARSHGDSSSLDKFYLWGGASPQIYEADQFWKNNGGVLSPNMAQRLAAAGIVNPRNDYVTYLRLLRREKEMERERKRREHDESYNRNELNQDTKGKYGVPDERKNKNNV